MSFEGLRVLSLETRKAAEMEKLIVRHGGAPLVVPSVKERPLDRHESLDRFVRGLSGGVFDLVVCMTGVGLAYARDVLEARGMLEAMVEGLRRVTIVSRGPKPVSILRALQVPIHVLIPEPNTWREIVSAIATRTERRIAVQEYGRPNAEMNRALGQLGATVTPVEIYRWDLPEDTAPLRRAAHALARGDTDVVLFTSSIQLDHLLQMASEEGIQPQVRDALSRHVAIASIGPVMNDALAAHGFAPDIVPDHPKMGALVKAAAERCTRVRALKRAG
jgi:uroporphyrinogen-III synthase